MAAFPDTTPSGVHATGLPAKRARSTAPTPSTIADLIARERIRNRIESAVARLIDALDAIDGDPDLENGHDAEALNEDGGDIVDEPHDDEGLDEPNTTGVYGNSGVQAHA